MAKYPGTLETNNISEYGIVKADQIQGHRVVVTKNDLTNLTLAQVSVDKTQENSIGAIWYVKQENAFYYLPQGNPQDINNWKELGLLEKNSEDDYVLNKTNKLSIPQIKTQKILNKEEQYLFTSGDNNSVVRQKDITSIKKGFCDMGEFETEAKALNALGDLTYCSSNAYCVLHAHYSKEGKECNMVCIQSFNEDAENDKHLVRQFLFNRDKVWQRCIYFTDKTRTEIKSRDNWEAPFCDRLHWDADTRKLVPSLFGYTFNKDYTDAIPLSNSTTNGLMSAAQAAKLDTASTNASNAVTTANTANTTASAAKTAAATNATAIAAHDTRLAALEATEAYTYVVAVAKADGGTITIGSEALTVKKGVNRWTLDSGQEGISIDADAKAHVTSLSLTGAKVKARPTDLQGLLNGDVTIHSLHLPALDVSAVTSLKNFASQNSPDAAYTVAGGKLTSFTGIEGWDVSKVTSFERVFANHALTSLDLSRWDVGAATHLSYLFTKSVWCASRLTSVGDLSAWDVSNVRSMGGMFNGCTNLEHIGDISKWDTSKCTIISYMFFDCRSLTSLDLSGWDTSKLIAAPYLFHGCAALTELDCSGWDLRSLNPESFPSASGCAKLATFKLGEGWGRIPGTPTLDLAGLSKWTGDTVLTLCDLYDRTQDPSLGTMTIKLHADTYAKLGADNISALTAKGYTITK